MAYLHRMYNRLVSFKCVCKVSYCAISAALLFKESFQNDHIKPLISLSSNPSSTIQYTDICTSLFSNSSDICPEHKQCFGENIKVCKYESLYIRQWNEVLPHDIQYCLPPNLVTDVVLWRKKALDYLLLYSHAVLCNCLFENEYKKATR